MTFIDQLRFVRQNMKKNKTRIFMTVLATAMGCCFLIVLASVGFGLQRSIVDRIVGDRLVTAIDVYGKQADSGIDQSIDDQDLKKLRAVDHVKAVTYRNYIRQPVARSVEGEELAGGGVISLDFEAEKLAGFGLSAGRLPASGNEVVVGFNLREPNDGNAATAADKPRADEWLGKTIRLEVRQWAEDGTERTSAIEATIVGVAAEPTREWKKDRDVYIGGDLLQDIERFTETQWGETRTPPSDGNGSGDQAANPDEGPRSLQQPRQYESVQVIAAKANHVKATAEEIREMGYYNHSIVNELEQVNLVFAIMKIGLVFVGTIAVLIASIGIFNTMTMAVTERAQDIGIMKAIGAHPSSIRRIFLLESGMIGVLGALFGTAISYVISVAVNFALPIVVETFMEEQIPSGFTFSSIPPYLALLACLISLGVAVLSGMRPARRATRIDVLRALRRDL